MYKQMILIHHVKHTFIIFCLMQENENSPSHFKVISKIKSYSFNPSKNNHEIAGRFDSCTQNEPLFIMFNNDPLPFLRSHLKLRIRESVLKLDSLYIKSGSPVNLELPVLLITADVLACERPGSLWIPFYLLY